MNAGKKARYQQSISNQTSIFGIMGGLAPRIGKTDVAVYRHILIKGGKGLPEGKRFESYKTKRLYDAKESSF